MFLARYRHLYAGINTEATNVYSFATFYSQDKETWQTRTRKLIPSRSCCVSGEESTAIRITSVAITNYGDEDTSLSLTLLNSKTNYSVQVCSFTIPALGSVVYTEDNGWLVRYNTTSDSKSSVSDSNVGYSDLTEFTLTSGYMLFGVEDAATPVASTDITLDDDNNVVVLTTGGTAFSYFATGTDASNLTGTLADARLPTTGVTAGTYNSLTVDTYGRVTTATSLDYLQSTLGSAMLWVGDDSGVASAVSVSGDASLDNSGALTVSGLQGFAVTAPTAVSQVPYVSDYTNQTIGFTTAASLIPSFVGASSTADGTTGLPAAPVAGEQLASFMGSGDWAQLTFYGDIKGSYQTADHGGWVLLDGRDVSDLTTTQQAAWATISSDTTLPDGAEKFLLGAGSTYALGTTGGSFVISEANLPTTDIASDASMSFTPTGTVATTTNVTVAKKYPLPNSTSKGNLRIFAINDVDGISLKSEEAGNLDGDDSGYIRMSADVDDDDLELLTGYHNHTATATSSSTFSGKASTVDLPSLQINTTGSQTDFILPYFTCNWFMFLGV